MVYNVKKVVSVRAQHHGKTFLGTQISNVILQIISGDTANEVFVLVISILYKSECSDKVYKTGAAATSILPYLKERQPSFLADTTQQLAAVEFVKD